MSDNTPALPSNFIRNIIREDLSNNKNDGRVVTRFPPEPNGYLHIGHAKSICINFGLARDFNGQCNLRMDDTNPVKEEDEFVQTIIDTVHWLGFDWGDNLFYASDYFEQLYSFAEQLIQAGKESPYRDRSAEENLDLFRRMRAGEFADGSKVLRAKIDMASSNINLRDPVMYRILHAHHHRTGDKWCIYPMYDFAHGQSDSIEGVTHSICTLEFEDHRPLYDWFVRELGIFAPQQIEFARLNLTYTVMSKRRLLELVRDKYVNGWDDPRMPTLVGLRRRGYTSAAIRNFCERIGVGKSDSTIDMSVLEDCLREDLNETAPRAMGVLRPLKVIIDNYPEGQTEEFDAPNHPQNPDMGTRKVPFSREIYIERDDFMEDPPKKFFRLGPGREVRLRCAYFIKCEEVVKDPTTGEVTEIHCTYDPATRGGSAPDGRKVKGTIHWVSAAHAVKAEVRMYDRLFTQPSPGSAKDGRDYKEDINPDSLEILTDCLLEPGLQSAPAEAKFQFERLGYFCVDSDSTPERPVFNRTVTLRDSWAKM